MKFYFAMKKFPFTLVFTANEMKCDFFSGVVMVKRPFKKCKQIRARYNDKHVRGKNAGIYRRSFTLKSTQQLVKFQIFKHSTNDMHSLKWI